MTTETLPETPATGQEPVLMALEQMLTRQLTFARDGDVAGVEELCPQVRGLLIQAGRFPAPETPECEARIERIGELHKELELTLATLKSDLVEKLKRLKNGKKTVRAYGEHA